MCLCAALCEICTSRRTIIMKLCGVIWPIIVGFLVFKNHMILGQQPCMNYAASDAHLEKSEVNKTELHVQTKGILPRNKGSNVSLDWDYIGPANERSTLTSDDLVEYIFLNNTRNAEEYFPSPKERETITGLRKTFLSNYIFDPSRVANVSKKCKQQAEMYINALQNFDLWALKMYDSSGHMSSGVLNGNINQFGDFDHCLGIQGPLDNLKGQYCLAYLQPEIPSDYRKLKKLHKLIQSHNAFISDFHDPGHRIPRFSIINWAICMPAGCSPLDVENTLKGLVQNITLEMDISVQVRVDPEMCQMKGEKSITKGTKRALYFFAIYILMCFLSTIYDKYTFGEPQNEWLIAFSLRKNLRWVFSVEDNSNDIKTVHGIRFINAVMLLFSHKSMAVFFNPYVNRTELSEGLGKPWTVIGRAASLYTDPFLLFSAMLTAYAIIGRLHKGRPANLRSEYIGRMLRIVPTLGALIAFCTFILPLMGSGPQWNLVIGRHSELCKKYWWRNLLFIHNYFGFENMCLTHTHHLGIDTQLFLLSPAAIIGLWKRPRATFVVLSILMIAATFARFYTTIVNELSNYVYFGATVKRLFKTADYMYTLPMHRSTVYMLGLLMGYALQVYRDVKLTKNQLRFGWFLSIVCLIGTIFGPSPMGDISYTYVPLHAAYYAAFAPLTWCYVFIWIVFTSHNGYDSKICRILSWRGFQVATKLSYSVYLTQFPVFFYNVGRRRNADYYSFLETMLNTNEYFCIFVASVVLTILFDAPFKNIKSILFKTQTNKHSTKGNGENNTITKRLKLN